MAIALRHPGNGYLRRPGPPVMHLVGMACKSKSAKCLPAAYREAQEHVLSWLSLQTWPISCASRTPTQISVPAINRLVHLLSVGDRGGLCSCWRYSRWMIQEMARFSHESYVFIIGVSVPFLGQNMASLRAETWRILMQVSSLTRTTKFSNDNFHLTRVSLDIGQKSTLSQLLEYVVVFMKAHLKREKSGRNVSVQTAQGIQRPSCSFACHGPWPLIDQGDAKEFFLETRFLNLPRGGTSMCSAMDNHRRARCHCAPPAVGDSNNALYLPVRVQHLCGFIHKLVWSLNIYWLRI